MEQHFMETPRRIYLAGPMSGYVDHNHAQFNAKAGELRKLGHFVFNPAEANPVDESATYRHCMAVDLTWICAFAECLVFLPGWQDSKGARAEYYLAKAIGIPALRYSHGEWIAI